MTDIIEIDYSDQQTNWFDSGFLQTDAITYLMSLSITTQEMVDAGTRPEPPAPFNELFGFDDGSIICYGLGKVYSTFGVGKLDVGLGGSIRLITQAIGGFDDFAIYLNTESDPISGLMYSGTQGNNSGNVGDSWQRMDRVFLPPKTARFFSPYVRFAQVPAGGKQYLGAAQLEVLPLTSSAPSAYVSPRQIESVVRPDRLNYCTNPSFEAGTSGWSSSATISQSTTEAYGTGTHSLEVVSTIENDYIETTLSDLRDGFPYIASLYYYDTRIEKWTRWSETFTASGTSYTLQWTVPYVGTTYVDDVLVEDGSTLMDYFDGDSGDDYLWEGRLVSGDSGYQAVRSYYYQDRAKRTYLITQTLNDNVAFGVSVGTPQFAVAPPLT